MAYTNVWSDTTPTGAEAANTIDDIFRSLKVDIEQRFTDLFAMPNFTADPLRPYGLKLTDAQDAVINLGDNTGTPRSLIVKDKAGANTYLTINSTVVNPAVPVNVTGTAGLAIGTVTGRRRLESTSASAFQLLGDANTVADLSILNLTVGGSSAVIWNAQSKISSPSDGVLTVTNNAVTGFNRIQLGGTSASFPAIARNATTVKIRLADDSADAPLTASTLTLSSGLNITGGGATVAGGINITGGGLAVTGGITGALTGNASTATALQTPRTINGVSFDGTANITIPVIGAFTKELTADTSTTTTSFINAITGLGALTTGTWDIAIIIYSKSSAGAGVKRLLVKLVAGTPGNLTESKLGYSNIGSVFATIQGKYDTTLTTSTALNDADTSGGFYTVLHCYVKLSGSSTFDLQFANESGTETQQLLKGTSLIAIQTS